MKSKKVEMAYSHKKTKKDLVQWKGLGWVMFTVGSLGGRQQIHAHLLHKYEDRY